MTAATGAVRVSARPGAISATALVGRDEELAALAAAVAHPPALAVVEGEAGIGKTRLVDELRSRQEAAGRLMVAGSCRQVRDPFPLGPVIEAVRRLREPLAAATLSPVAGVLRPLLPELADLLPPAPEPLADRQAERHRLYRALVEVLRAAGPAVVHLEDLHWADDHTPDFLRYLLADPPPGLTTVLTYRGEEVAPAIRALPARLPAAVHRVRMRLAPLDPAGTGALAAAILGTDQVSEEFAAYLCERASGLPFAIEELLALLRARGSVTLRDGGWARRALDQLDVPVGIRDQVLERVSHLGPYAQSVLAAAAVLQAPVTLPVLAATCRLSRQRALSGVEEALAAGVLAETGDTVGFRHILAAQAVYGAVPRLRRRQLHARAANAWWALDRPPLGQVAQHLRHARRTAKWIEVAEQAADQAVTLGHDGEATRLLEELLRHAHLDTAHAGRIAVKLAGALQSTAGGEDVVGLLESVLARDLAGPVRGELCLLTALVMDNGRHDLSRQRQLCLEAVAHLDPHRGDLRAWAMACLGIPLGTDVPLAEHRDWLRRALAEQAGTSDQGTRARLLGKVAMVQVLVGDPQWRELVERIDGIGVIGEQRRYSEQAWAYYAIGVEACYAGHHDLAESLLARALAHTASWERPFRRASLLSARALVDYCRGDWEGLQPRVERLIDQLADFTPARVEAELVAGCLRLAHGDLTGARDLLGAPPTGHSGPGLSGLCAAAAIRLALGCGDAAGGAAVVYGQLARVHAQGLWAPVTRCLPAMIRALVTVGDLPGARDLHGQAEVELGTLDAPLAAAVLGHAAGTLAAAERHWREAAGQLLAAAGEYERLRCPYEAAQAREEAGACLSAAGDPAAPGPLRAALTAYRRLGATWDLDRAAGLARRYGISPPARHRRGRRGYGDQLSPRERDVARLLAAGRSNPEIAGELYLSVSTVEKHVMAVLRKLAVDNRVQVADRLHTGAPAPGLGVPGDPPAAAVE